MEPDMWPRCAWCNERAFPFDLDPQGVCGPCGASAFLGTVHEFELTPEQIQTLQDRRVEPAPTTIDGKSPTSES